MSEDAKPDWRLRWYWAGVLGIAAVSVCFGELLRRLPGVHWTERVLFFAFEPAIAVLVGGGLTLVAHRVARRAGGPGITRPVVAAWWWTFALAVFVLFAVNRHALFR